MYNPYLNEVRQFYEFDRDFPMDADYWRKYRNVRRKYAYAIPTEGAIKLIASYSPICEMGAGTGYWAFLLNNYGCDIVAYDNYLPPYDGEEHYFDDDAVLWFNVQKCDSFFVPPIDRTLFLCWPPYDELMAYNVLSRYAGDRLIYIGEDCGGATADDNFYRVLSNNWTRVYEFEIPQFYGLHDWLSIYERKPYV